MRLALCRKLQLSVQAILQSVEDQAWDAEGIQNEVASLRIPPPAYVQASARTAATAAVQESKAASSAACETGGLQSLESLEDTLQASRRVISSGTKGALLPAKTSGL